MNARRLLVPVVVVCVAATGTAEAAAVKRITATRVGAVHLHERFAKLRAEGRVGKLRTECELSGTNSKGAALKAPLRGSVGLSAGPVRRVRVITVTSRNAKARGIGVGSTRHAVRTAFPKARFDHSSDAVFGITIVKIPRSEGGPWQLGVDTATHKVTVIGVPTLSFCD
jgi:hypothetical protein